MVKSPSSQIRKIIYVTLYNNRNLKMKKSIKILGLSVFTILIVCGTFLLTKTTSYSNWRIENNSYDKSTISWTKFEWTNEELGGKWFDKTSMNIPCRMDGINNPLLFQFDLGADLTGVYENTFTSVNNQNPILKNKIKKLWDIKKYFENLNIIFGSYVAINKAAYVYKNFGEKKEIQNLKDTVLLGTIGADIFKNKTLIIDYPNNQFAICENTPKIYQDNLIDIELDRFGRVILPMKIHGNSFRIIFDNGSSIFPIITNAKNISKYSTSVDIDTIQISSWGQTHGVTGKLIKDTFELAGQRFSNVKVYANHSGFGIDNETDGMTGNALFWDKTLIIDFKNKKFGVN
jgi:hypothetical protein